MKPEIKSLWLAALRSDEYTQTKGCLHDDGGFCCLGVLTDVFIKATGEQWERGKDKHAFAFAGEGSTLCMAVREWAGLAESNPGIELDYISTITGRPERASLANVNDSGTSFADIAKYIEKSL